MAKITFLGAGSSTFVKNILGDVMLTQSLRDSHLALYDIDAARLEESRRMLETLNANINQRRARITTHLGPGSRRNALRNADYVVNAIQVGGYRPATVIDFEIPKKYGLRQTIGDTLGIGGIFRALRSIPVLLDFARDMGAVCPNAWFLNYTNPMAMLTSAMLRGTGIRTVGLCHSVQACVRELLDGLSLNVDPRNVQAKIAGINHQAWLLELTHNGKDLYPEIKIRAMDRLKAARKPDGARHPDMVRHYLMLELGYYVTESSEHSAEYLPYFIKNACPELIREFNIPLDEYPRRCEANLRRWKAQSRELIHNPTINHERSNEYGSRIMEAMETDVPYRIGGNVMNTGLIPNLPAKACVEIPCMVDRNGVQGCYVGDLPEVCAAINRTNINVQILTVDAALTRRKECIYQAAMLDPHTAAELPIDKIKALCDELIQAHGRMLPKYRETVIRPPRIPLATLKSLAPLRVLGPFENQKAKDVSLGLSQVLPPETELNLKATFKGKANRRIRWKTVKAGDLKPGGFVDLCALLGQVDLAVAYALIVLHADRGQTLPVHLGSDDALAVWLNGKGILRHDVPRAAHPLQNTVNLKLRKGRNQLLLKISQERGGWGFYAQIDHRVQGVAAVL